MSQWPKNNQIPSRKTGVPPRTLILTCICNPNGIASFSPGLRGTSYPGYAAPMSHNPNGVAAMLVVFAPRSHNPFRVVIRRLPFPGEKRTTATIVRFANGLVPRNPGLWDRIPLGFSFTLSIGRQGYGGATTGAPQPYSHVSGTLSMQPSHGLVRFHGSSRVCGKILGGGALTKLVSRR